MDLCCGQKHTARREVLVGLRAVELIYFTALKNCGAT